MAIRDHKLLFIHLVSILLYASSIVSIITNEALSVSECSLEAQQFSVVVETNVPLGLRLSEKLEVLEFIADSEGRGRAVESSGLAEIGDRLVAINDILLEGFTLHKAVRELQTAPLPRTLRFQTHDGRCVQPPSNAMKESAIDAATASTVTYDPSNEEVYDYVVSSVGDKATELQLYAVLSSDASPPSCTYRELVLARPFTACSPLSINVAEKYVLVPSIFGCPMHQKAAMAEEAGAKGVVFVQRVGEKPMQVRIPPASSLPQPIHIPLVMISSDSGARLLEQMAGLRPDESQQLRFVFIAACAVDRFSVHPGDSDPLHPSAAFLIEDASAGFMSVSVATSAETELASDTYEFLKSRDSSSSQINLPIGRHDLVFPDLNGLNPCAADPVHSLPFAHSRHNNMAESFIAIRPRDPKDANGCSLTRQLAFFEARRPMGIIIGDERFPHAASSLTTAVAVQQISVPVVFVSINSLRTMRQKLQDLTTNTEANAAEDSKTHIHVEFNGENSLEHQWKELAGLAVESNWPATEAARDRLFHRMMKDQATLDDHDLQSSLIKNERHEALVASYRNAQRYYGAHTNDASNDSQ